MSEPCPSEFVDDGVSVARECGDGVTIAAILRSGLDDWILLDEVAWEAMLGDASETNRAATIRVLDRMFRDGLVVPGALGESGFEDWPGSPDQWLAQAHAELERLGWRPMGAGSWLRLTDLGERVARADQDE